MRPDIPSLILAAWVIATVVFYWRLDARQATLIAILGGWAFLPTGDYPAEFLRVGREYSGPMHALAIPGSPRFNKATAIGLGCLCGLVLFDWASLLRTRPRWFDLPMACWVLIPIASTVANGLPVGEGLAQSRSLALAWGVPYVVGRVWFADGPALRLLARAWVTVGLAYLPFCLAEFVVGPFWYEIVYGGHVYRFDGSDRWIGHRPLVFLEHGNQLGLWSATSAVAATWLWALGDLKTWGWRRLQVPGSVVVGILIGTSVAWQSHGAILLMIVALFPLMVIGRPGKIGRGLIALAGILMVTVGLAAGAWVIRRGLGGLRDQLRGLFHGIGKSSFTWRLARLVENFPQLAQRPILGWGRADWSSLSPDGSFLDPIAISLWFLAAGMYGGLGLLALASLLLLPIVASALKLRSLGSRTSPGCYLAVILAIVSLNVADLFFNSGFLLPILIGAGGLSGLTLGRDRSGRISF